MPRFFDRIAARAQAIDSLLCVGLDPHPDDLPEQTAAAALTFCRRIVTSTRPYACAFKPNAAFFEAFGAEGVAALRTLVRELEPDVPVILDAKRGDIASTAAAYASACFDEIGATCVTLHPYLGADSVAPFLKNPRHGVFILCRTSNPGATELQELPCGDGAPLFVQVAAAVARWDATAQNDTRLANMPEGVCAAVTTAARPTGQCGLVVGATAPGALPAVRAANADAWILSPGIGAQGGDLAATVEAALRDDGLGLLVSVSRGISRAADPAAAAAALVAQISAAAHAAKNQPTATNQPMATHQPTATSRVSGAALDRLGTAAGRALADGLLRAGCVRFGSFTLKSGLTSPIYLDLRRLSGDPGLLRLAAAAYATLLRELTFDRLAALPYAGLPIGTAVSLAGDWPLCYPRKQKKAHGTGAAIEGPHHPGEVMVVIDDLATRGTSALEALPILRAAGLVVRDLVVLVDRASGAAPRLAANGVTLHAVYTLPALLDHWRANGAISAARHAEVHAFLGEAG